MTGTRESCSCARCTQGCDQRPGWFKPGEVERTAELLGMSVQDLFDRYLVVDWWVATEDDQPDAFVLQPGYVHEPTGTEGPAWPGGRCIFLNPDRTCAIHAAKPAECAHYFHEDEGGNPMHRACAEAWDTPEHQAQITELLGREPKLPSPLEAIGGWLDSLAPGLGSFFGGDDDD